MRISHRLKTLMPLVLASFMVAEASAQQMMGSPSYGAPAFMGGPQQNYSGAPGQALPPSFRSHPTISPFDHAFEQHFSSDGLWFKRTVGAMEQMNDFYFNIDYTRTRTRNLRGFVGDHSAPTFDQDSLRDNAGAFPDALFLPTFPHRNIREVDGNQTQGIRLSGGVKNKAGWRFAWNVDYNGESTNRIDRRAILESQRLHFFDAVVLEATGGITNGQLHQNLRGIDERQILEDQILNIRTFDAANAEEFGVAGSTEDILDRNLFPFGSIGIQTGDDIDGVSQLFDLDFIMKHEVKSYGTGFHFSSSPMLEKGSLTIRPLFGARYFRLHENFSFVGVDSGLDYTPNVPDGLDDDDDFVIDNVDENGTLDFTDPVTDDTQEILVRSFVNSNVRSTMAGPEIGVEYEVAKKGGVTFSGSTRVGALVNTENLHLEGDNIGDTLTVETDPITGLTVRSDLFDTTTAGGQRTLNFFRDNNSTTHISPLFEQALTAELPIFSKVPVLRNIWQLEHAKLRLGWKYTFIGEVADPNQSIVWVSNPRDGIFPHLNVKRTKFFQNQYSLGINWEF